MLSVTPLHFERQTNKFSVPEGEPHYGRSRYLTDCRRFSFIKHSTGHDTHWRIAKALRYFDAHRTTHEYHVWQAWLIHVGLNNPSAWATRSEAVSALQVCLAEDPIAAAIEAGYAHRYQPIASGLCQL